MKIMKFQETHGTDTITYKNETSDPTLSVKIEEKYQKFNLSIKPWFNSYDIKNNKSVKEN